MSRSAGRWALAAATVPPKKPRAVHWDGLAHLKKRLDEMLPPTKYDGGEKVVKRPKPYTPPTAPDKMADWMGKEPGTDPRLPLKPPGR